MKKGIAVLFLLALMLALTVPAFAAASEYVFDFNNNLSANELSELNALAAEVYYDYGFDILIDMDDNETQDAVSYAELRYDQEDASENGILLAITAEEWYIHLAGEAENIFDEFYIDYLWEAYDVERTYYGGVEAYIISAHVILDMYYGEEDAAETPVIPETRQKPRFVDEADLLTTAEDESLLAVLDEISERQECDVAVVTVSSLGNKTAEAYADDYYDYNGYGMGSGDDGILLLISIEDRDWAITTYGFGISAFTDAGQSYMVAQFKSDLSAGNYASAFSRFAELCDDFLTQAKTGEPYDSGHLPNTMSFGRAFIATLVITLPLGFILAMIITASMKKKMQSVAMQASAGSYVRQGSVEITASRDNFLYRTLVKTAKESESSSGGGSRTHTSSSGRSHGGSSGKF